MKKFEIRDYHTVATNYEANCKTIKSGEYTQIDIISTRAIGAPILEAHLYSQSQKSKEYNFFQQAGFGCFIIFASKK